MFNSLTIMVRAPLYVRHCRVLSIHIHTMLQTYIYLLSSRRKEKKIWTAKQYSAQSTTTCQVRKKERRGGGGLRKR